MNGFGGLSEGYQVGAQWRERRLRERGMMESYGVDNIQTAYAQEMLRQRTQQDVDMIFKMYQIDPQAAVRAFNEHPLLGPSFGPLKYHPDHKILTTGSGGVLDIYQDENGKMKYSYEQVVPLEVLQQMKPKDKVKVTRELPNGITITGTAQSMGLDPDGDNIVNMDLAEAIETQPTVGERLREQEIKLKEREVQLKERKFEAGGGVDIQDLMRQQDAKTQSLNALLKKGGMIEYQGLNEEDKEKADTLMDEIESMGKKIDKAIGGPVEKAPPPNFNTEVQNAYSAIDQGSDLEAVKKLFKERTGMDLPERKAPIGATGNY